MSTGQDLKSLEQQAYLETYSDGSIDLFVGLSLTWIGAAWIWLPDFAGIAGVFPAIFITAMLSARKRLLESRLGYVKWSEPRRRWERQNLYGLFAAGTAIFLIGIAAFLVVSDGPSLLIDWVAALPAALLALVAVGLGAVMRVGRIIAHGCILTAAAAATVIWELAPGWPLFVSGLAVTVTGLVMLTRFLARNPVVDPA
jgi:hypothetical protein